MEELPCGFSNAVNYKNSFLVLKFSNHKFRGFFYFSPKKSFPNPSKWGCTVFPYDALYLRNPGDD